MSFNATRLTLYAIISALEVDLREAIELNLNKQKRIEEIFGVKLLEKIFLRLQKEQSGPTGTFALGELVQYLDFDETFQVLNSNRDSLPADVAERLRGLTPQFQKLAPIRNRVMHARPLEFEDLSVCLDTVENLRASKLFSWAAIEATLNELRANPAFVFGLSIPVINDDKISHNLPTPDFDETGFIGRRASELALEKLLLGGASGYHRCWRRRAGENRACFEGRLLASRSREASF